MLAKRFARLRVLISDPPRTNRNGNRLVGLGRRLNTHIEFRNLHEDYRHHREAFLLADDTALLPRGPYALGRYRGHLRACGRTPLPDPLRGNLERVGDLARASPVACLSAIE